MEAHTHEVQGLCCYAKAKYASITTHYGYRSLGDPFECRYAHGRCTAHQNMGLPHTGGIKPHRRMRIREKLTWLRRRLLEWQRDMPDAKEFMESLKIDFFRQSIRFTPWVMLWSPAEVCPRFLHIRSTHK